MVITLGYAADRSEVVLVVDHVGLERLIGWLQDLNATAAPDHMHRATFTNDLTEGELDDAEVVHQLRIRLLGAESGRDMNPHPSEWLGPIARPESRE